MTENQNASRLQVLGGFTLTTAAGAPIAVSSRKAQVLLAYLAQRSGHAVSRAKLAAMFWSDTQESEARHSLRQCLLVLRQTLAPVPSLLEIGPDAVRLRRERMTTDAMELEALIAGGSEESIDRAAALYRGEFLEGVRLAGEPIDEWIVFERRRIAHLVRRALLGLIETSKSAGRVEDAIQTATRLLAIDPQQEEVRTSLVRLYGRAEREGGRRSAIIATTDSTARRIAGDVLGNAGFDIRNCLDGADVLLEIGASEPDVLLIDTNLPLFEPADLVRALAAKIPDLPLICIGEGSEEIESAMLSLGAADFVAKPIDPEVLLIRVDNTLNRERRKSMNAR
jgi:DNA-binding SARP family transcriptional activator